MEAAGFIKERVGLFKDFTTERIKELVDGSVIRSFESNEAIAHQGAEARQGHDSRIFRLSVTLLFEGRSDPQAD